MLFSEQCTRQNPLGSRSPVLTTLCCTLVQKEVNLNKQGSLILQKMVGHVYEECKHIAVRISAKLNLANLSTKFNTQVGWNPTADRYSRAAFLRKGPTMDHKGFKNLFLACEGQNRVRLWLLWSQHILWHYMVLVSRAESSPLKLQLNLKTNKIPLFGSFSHNYSDSPTCGLQKSAFISMSMPFLVAV